MLRPSGEKSHLDGKVGRRRRRFGSAAGAVPWSAFRMALLCLLAAIAGCSALKRCAYEGISRDDWQKPERVIEALNIRPGHQVADLGAGSGYFTFRLADRVGPNGKVYAIDVDPDMTDYLSEQARATGSDNVQVVLTEPDAPSLPESGVDLVFACNVYHHIEDPRGYFAKVKTRLRPGGRLAIIDFSGEGWLESWSGHATEAGTVKADLEVAGYRLEQELEFLPKQIFLIFTPGQQHAPGD